MKCPVLSALSLTAAILLSCSLAMAGGDKITISAGAGPMSGALNVAEAKGYFEESGVKVQVISYKKGKIAFDKYLAGEDDIATCNLVGIVLSDFDITSHKLIAGLAYSDNKTVILGKKSAGIAKPSDLKNKRIGLVRATSAHFYFWKFMALNGISPNDVEIIFMEKKKLPEAIASGQIDAICQHGMPIEKAKKKLEDDWVAFQEDSIHRISVQMIAPTQWINDNPNKVKAVLKGALDAEKHIKTNTEDSVRILAKAKGYPEDVMDKTVRNHIEFNLSLPQSLLLSLETVEQWAIDNKLVDRTEPRNYLGFIDYRPLENVSSNKVAILR